MRGKDLERLVETLDGFPDELMEKQLTLAIREATKLFQGEARAGVRKIKAQPSTTGKPKEKRWGEPATAKLSNAIRRKVKRNRSAVIGTIFVKDQGGDRSYAAPVEYGHKMFIPVGRGVSVRMQPDVPKQPFWRPAKDKTARPIQTLIVSSLRRRLKEFNKGNA